MTKLFDTRVYCIYCGIESVTYQSISKTAKSNNVSVILKEAAVLYIVASYYFVCLSQSNFSFNI
jgi:hypothetical protein